MSKFVDIGNQYFIEMVRKPQAKEELSTRLLLSPEERAEVPLPVTDNINDAFYVVLGCKFQDSPIKTMLQALIFIVIIGLVLANIIIHSFT